METNIVVYKNGVLSCRSMGCDKKSLFVKHGKPELKFLTEMIERRNQHVYGVLYDLKVYEIVPQQIDGIPYSIGIGVELCDVFDMVILTGLPLVEIQKFVKEKVYQTIGYGVNNWRNYDME